MMLLMMRRRYQAFTEPSMNDSTRKYFPAHMIGDAHDRHYRQHQPQCADMDRDQKHQRRNDNRAGERLPWVKAHGRPSGWRAALMVDGMGRFEPPRPMHQPVGPVKPSVMGEQVKKAESGRYQSG